MGCAEVLKIRFRFTGMSVLNTLRPSHVCLLPRIKTVANGQVQTRLGVKSITTMCYVRNVRKQRDTAIDLLIQVSTISGALFTAMALNHDRLFIMKAKIYILSVLLLLTWSLQVHAQSPGSGGRTTNQPRSPKVDVAIKLAFRYISFENHILVRPEQHNKTTKFNFYKVVDKYYPTRHQVLKPGYYRLIAVSIDNNSHSSIHVYSKTKEYTGEKIQKAVITAMQMIDTKSELGESFIITAFDEGRSVMFTRAVFANGSWGSPIDSDITVQLLPEKTIQHGNSIPIKVK